MNRLTITTPREGHYIELISRLPLSPQTTPDNIAYVGLCGFRLVRGARELRWRFDDWVPAELMMADFGGQQAVMTAYQTAGPQLLDKKGFIEFKVHLTSPLAPRTLGVWLRIIVSYDDQDGLVFNKGGIFKRTSQAWLFDGTQWAEARSDLPDWLRGDRLPWVIEAGHNKSGHWSRSLSAGNVLLNASWDDASPLHGNLVNIDERLKGDTKDDYRFSLMPDGPMDHWDIGTELLVDPRFGAPAPVSHYALGLSHGRRALASLGARGLNLRCLPQLDGAELEIGWQLRWQDIPGQPGPFPPHTFTLESFSEAHFGAHAFGLATTRSRNRLSIVPTKIDTLAPDARCEMVFKLTRKDFDVVDIQLQRVGFAVPTPVRLTCGGAAGTDGDAWDMVAMASEPDTPPSPPYFLHWKLERHGTHANAHQIGAGSVLLKIDDFVDGQLLLSCSGDGEPYGRSPPEADLKLNFKAVRYGPLSLDPEVGFETLSAHVQRPRPWTFDLEPGTKTCTATFWEKASKKQSRLLHIQLHAPAQGDVTSDVILVDPSPFTVVRVRSTERIRGREIVAEYVDDSDQAPEWRFHSEFGEMTAVLPPQGIGEEMVKGYLFMGNGAARTVVPRPGRLFDFRLTPVAHLTLDRTDIDTARSEAPWSLRRLLGQRSGTIGVKLDGARFELLYGLQAQVKAPALRIAELDGLVGRPPYPDALMQALVRSELDIPGPVETYARQVAQWQAGLWHRPSWWRVFSDATQRKALVLQDGVQYRLRCTRTTANPFEIDTHATPEGKALDAPWSREPLRGGVDWPFQSRNIYDELIDSPVSSSGSIEGLAFGSLGGEGAQTAAFNNGKTLIISSSRQGRLDSLTLIRVGRIAMTWNKARHVIVYERTTRRAPRYDYVDPAPTADDLDVQPELDGMAALRKVREYVEITEPRRRYPDSVTERPVAGPLVQSTFGTTVIPVMSSWGRDVPKGFAIALRGPIPPGREKFFPEPQVFLDFARPADKGGGAVSQRITSTDRLVFFSSTRDEDGGDTDLWPAWPDIDFPSIRPPTVSQLPFRSSFTGLRQPDAPAAELGMTPFTLELARAEEAVNLMHGRRVPGLEARLSNINLARGLPERPVLLGDAEKAQAAAQQFSGQRAQLLDGLGDLRAAARQLAMIDGGKAIPSDAGLQRDLRGLLTTLRAKIPKPNPAVPGLDLAQAQLDRNAAYLNGIGDEARQLAAQVRRLSSAVTPVGPDGMDTLRRQAVSLLDAVNLQAKERLGNLSVVRIEALEQGRGVVDGLIRRLSAHFDLAASQVAQAMTTLRAQCASQPDGLVAFETAWRDRVAKLPFALRGLIETLAPSLDGALGQWFSRVGQGGTLHDRVQAPVEGALGGLADYLDRWLAALPPFDVQQPDFDQLEAELVKLFDPRIAAELLKDLVDEFQSMLAELGNWDQALQAERDRLDQAINALQSDLLGAADPAALVAKLEGYAAGLQAGLTQMALDVVGSLQLPPSVEAGMKALQGSFDTLKDSQQEIEKAIGFIEAQAEGTVGELERVVQEQVAMAEAYIASGSRQLEDWARGQIAPSLEIGRHNVDAALETVRTLAEGPIAQGLQATRDQVGYYFDKARDTLALTPTTALFNDLGRDALNALSASVPFDAIRDRLLPSIADMAVRDLFPDFCGIKLTDLLPDLQVPPLDGTHQYDWLTVQHGFDKERVSAWARVSIDKRFDDDATLFDLGPVKLRLLKPWFRAVADIIVEEGRQRQVTSGHLQAHFELSLNGKPMVTLSDGVLAFDERGRLDFQFDSEKLVLAEELNFIQQALRALMPQVEGLTLTPLLPAGIEAQLCLPLPDIGTGAFTLTGVTLNSNLGLRVGDGFEIRTGLWLSKPERPFGLAVLFLGGGGWFGIEASYKPPSRFVTRVSIGVSAGAFVALNFGFASGSAGLLFTAGVDFYRDWQTGSGTTALSLGLLMWGEFSILGIASAGVRLMLRITYEQGGMRGEGTLSVSIKICWCYTLRVNRTVAKQFSGGSSQRQQVAAVASQVLEAPVSAAAPAAAVPTRAKASGPMEPAAVGGAPPALQPFAPAVAVQRYFETLAI